jgi:hypothetical protein
MNGTIRLKAIVPEEVRFLFEPRPLLRGENPRHYDLLVACTVATIKPRDFVEWWLVKDLVDYEWEIRRLRLLKARIVDLNTHRAGTELLTRVFSPEETSITQRRERAHDAMSGYLAGGDEDANAEVEGALECLGVSDEALVTASVRYSLNSIEQIEALQTAAESRRSAVLQEIERRRFAMSHHSHKVQTVEDVDFEPVV